MITTDAPAFEGVPLDTRTIPQDRLNIKSKERSNLFPWNGQFSPQLVEVLLRTYSPSGGFVVDPFLGSGTVLCEAGRLGHPAFGSEINPAAFKMAAIYRFMNAKPALRRTVIGSIDDALQDALPTAPSLFSTSTKLVVPMQQILSQLIERATDIRERDALEALVVLLNYGDGELTSELVFKTWAHIRHVINTLPYPEACVDLANCDARVLPLATGRADTVITSPPYVNVFNYHQQYRKSVESLNWNLLEVAKSEIGSNRKYRSNRFLTVIQYCIDMAAVLNELRRVCKPTARVIVVIGRESNVRKTRFFNGEIVARLAVSSAGYQLDARQERVFQNRFGEWIYEDILHLIPTTKSDITPPSQIARTVLEATRERAPEESLDDLNRALEKLDEIQASPIYNSEVAISYQPSREKKEAV